MDMYSIFKLIQCGPLLCCYFFKGSSLHTTMCITWWYFRMHQPGIKI